MIFLVVRSIGSLSEVESRTQNPHNKSILNVGPSVVVEMPRLAIEALNLDVKHWNYKNRIPIRPLID